MRSLGTGSGGAGEQGIQATPNLANRNQNSIIEATGWKTDRLGQVELVGNYTDGIAIVNVIIGLGANVNH